MGRPFDIVGAAVGLLAVSPLMAIIATAVKVSDGGAVFYRARRVGRHGEPFDALKFRTMVANADKLGPGITTSGDPRVTSAGKLLRKTKLDELPQLINVLRGEMSLVGPRPEDPRYVADYTDDQRNILSVRPGMTSAASIQYRDEEALLTGENWETIYREEVLPSKIAIDLEYIRSRTAWSDLKIVLRTILLLFR